LTVYIIADNCWFVKHSYPKNEGKLAGKILKVNVAWLRPLLILDVKRENETGFRKRRNHRVWLMISGQNVVFLDRSEWVSEGLDRPWFEGWSRGLESGCLG
jgi:hypothetical protein